MLAMSPKVAAQISPGELSAPHASLEGLGNCTSCHRTIADECWCDIPNHFPNVELGAHLVMPNHVHGIIVINDEKIGMATKSSPSVGARHASRLPPRGVKPKSIGAIIGSFKSAVTRRIGRELNATGIWQRNYHEHIIRNDREMDRITREIESNPSRWAEDDENPLKP